ncbi:hypothetical protein AWB74_02951 [Caballeronia arvi]|uniref:Uncharacterized protein n=1 Tax=Caballeronia arvi TaxID=1777135 RepID=A0A158ITK2_9BURK|nr:hypothetical protein AWB74_02951 [Caballeronia arvi]
MVGVLSGGMKRRGDSNYTARPRAFTTVYDTRDLIPSL